MKFKFIFCFIFLSFFTYAQGDLSRQVKQWMEQVRAGAPVTVNKDKLLAGDAKSLVNALIPYCADTNLAVRAEALQLSMRLGTSSKEIEIVRKTIQLILSNVQVKANLNNQLLGLLRKYRKSDFSAVEVQLMRDLLLSQNTNVGTLAKIYAFAAETGAVADLKEVLGKATLSRSDKQDVKLALVRCGDEQLTGKMLETLKQQVLNDEFVYAAVPEIVYTRNKDMLGFLLKATLSNDKKCSSPNSDEGTPVICAYRLIEQLAPVIKNFPVQLNNRGELAEKDEGKLLERVRGWINTHLTSFEVETGQY